MPATPSGAGDLAKSLLESLMPEFDQIDPTVIVTKLTNDELTTGAVGGTGVFDVIMSSLVKHLKVEYEANRIAGAEYTKAYQAMVPAALQAAVQFLMGRDQAYLQNLLLRRQLETAEAEYALATMKLATEDATYGNLIKQGATLDYTLSSILPKQSTQLDNQNALLLVQKTGVEHDNTGKAYTNTNILPQQLLLLTEQVNVQRAQTSDSRQDGQKVFGAIGKQKDLYSQQITSYQRDAEMKATKLFTDAWITQKTIDEGLLAPNNFKNTEIDKVLTRLRANLNLLA